MNYIEEIVDNGKNILEEYLEMKNKIDGINRPRIFEIDKTKTVDDISNNVEKVALYLNLLLELVPMKDDLILIGKDLIDEGKIEVGIGDSISQKTIEYLKEKRNIK